MPSSRSFVNLNLPPQKCPFFYSLGSDHVWGTLLGAGAGAVLVMTFRRRDQHFRPDNNDNNGSIKTRGWRLWGDRGAVICGEAGVIRIGQYLNSIELLIHNQQQYLYIFAHTFHTPITFLFFSHSFL